MKFYASMVAHLLFGLFLGMGIYKALQGHYWLLTAAVVVYMIALTKLGCLPSNESH